MSGATANITDAVPIVGTLRNLSANRQKDTEKDNGKNNVHLLNANDSGEVSPEKDKRTASSLTHTFDAPEFIPDEMQQLLPECLRRPLSEVSDPVDREMLIYSMIVAASSIMPNVQGDYRGRRTHPNLYLFIRAGAASGKSIINNARQWIEPIDEMLTDQYLQALTEWEEEKDTNPGRPRPNRTTHLIPGNTTASLFVSFLNEVSTAAVFETEGGVVAKMFTSEHGDYSYTFRNAFHHETISLARKGNDEFIKVKNPRLSAVLCGTSDQWKSLMKSGEDGLASRFISIHVDRPIKWSPPNELTIDLGEVFYRFGKAFALPMYRELAAMQTPLTFEFSPEQWTQFNTWFSALEYQVQEIDNDLLTSLYFRAGVITYRVAMTLTVLHAFESDNEPGERITCHPDAFAFAMGIAPVIWGNVIETVEVIGGPVKHGGNNSQAGKVRAVINTLTPGEVFRTGELVEIIRKQVKVSQKTANRHIKLHCINEGHGVWKIK